MSTEELLTEDEMDALMEGIQEEESSADDGASQDVQPYELVSPENSVNGLRGILDTVNERLCHQLRIGFSELLRRTVDVTHGELLTQPYSEFTDTLSKPCSVNVVELKPLSGPGLLVFEQQLVFIAVDTFFGGVGRVYGATNERDFTTIENRFIQRLRKLVFKALSAAWAPFLAVECGLEGAESNPQFVTEIAVNEPLLLTTLTLSLSEEVSGLLHLALPCAMFETVRGQLLASLCKEHPVYNEKLSAQLGEGIKESEIIVRGALAKTELTLGELLTMKVGDFIPLDIPARATLEAEGIALYRGYHGIAKGQRALKIDQPVNPRHPSEHANKDQAAT